MSDTLIRITRGGTQRGLPVFVNGKRTVLPTDGTAVPVSDPILGALANSNAVFETVGAALSETPAGGEGGGAGEQAPSSPFPPLSLADLAILDQPIPAIMETVKDWGPGELGALVRAETAGKTRKSLISKIEALPQTFPA